VETLSESAINTAAQMVLAPLKEDPPSHLIVDLDGVRYFGSAFIAFLLRCHLPVKQQGGELVIAGVNDRIRELLRTTALDTIWALYGSRSEAIEALTD
jgi:anti-anti-sigma factor